MRSWEDSDATNSIASILHSQPRFESGSHYVMELARRCTMMAGVTVR